MKKTREGAELKDARREGGRVKAGGANAITAQHCWRMGNIASDSGYYQQLSSASGSMCVMVCCVHVRKCARRCAHSFETAPQSAV